MCNIHFLQICIGDDGGSCSILEHSSGDGPPSIAANIFVMDLLARSVYTTLINYVYSCIHAHVYVHCLYAHIRMYILLHYMFIGSLLRSIISVCLL